MVKRYKLQCNGELVVVERDGDDIIFHNYDPEVDEAMEALGDDPSPCFIAWKTLKEGTLDDSLVAAAKKNDLEVTLVLLFAGADPQYGDSEALMASIDFEKRIGDHEEVIRALVLGGANVNAHGGTPLYSAVEDENYSRALFLLEQGAWVDEDILVAAVQRQNEQLIHLVLGYDKDIGSHFKEALLSAISVNNPEIIKTFLLLEYPHDYIRYYSSYCDTALIHAVSGGHLAAIETLVKHDPDVLEHYGNKAINHGAYNEQTGAVVLLLKLGARPENPSLVVEKAIQQGRLREAANELVFRYEKD